ncbi:MAG TPA: hypothetical protein GXZ74_05795 [Tissierellia bacterium]|nr:hypothetical protein [Tissierellia bacterium]
MKRPLIDKANTTKWMLRGLLFVPILMITDYFYRQQRYSGSLMETVLMIGVIISVIGVLQLFLGVYAWLKHRLIDNG